MHLCSDGDVVRALCKSPHNGVAEPDEAQEASQSHVQASHLQDRLQPHSKGLQHTVGLCCSECCSIRSNCRVNYNYCTFPILKD